MKACRGSRVTALFTRTLHAGTESTSCLKCSPPGEPQYTLEQRAWWSPEEAWIIWIMGDSKPRSCSPQESQYTEHTIPAPPHTLRILTPITLTVAFEYADTITQGTMAQNGSTGGLSWLTWRVTGLSPQRLRVSHRSSRSWWVVDEVSLTEDFLSGLWLSHQHRFTNTPNSSNHLSLMLYYLSNWQHHQTTNLTFSVRHLN